MNQVLIQEIPIELLREHPENSNFMNASTAQKLRRHIEQAGRYEPLTVRPHPVEEGKFQVINGHNRLRILRALQYRNVNCIVWKLDDQQTRLYLATPNRLSGQDIPERRAILLSNLLRPVRQYEAQTNTNVQIPMQMLNSMGISQEDWDACWRKE